MIIAEFLKHSRQQLVTCRPEDALNAVAKLMYTHNIGAMPVCELGSHMVGIISERDLVRTFARTDLTELKYLRARDVITTRAISCGSDDTMLKAQEFIGDKSFSSSPDRLQWACRSDTFNSRYNDATPLGSRGRKECSSRRSGRRAPLLNGI
jgi:CBS domain-containing protein